MSSNQQTINTGQQSTTNYDTSKIFIWNNRYEKGTYTNSGYTTVALLMGTLVGRIGSSQKIVPCVSTASDGSQFPIGVLAGDYSVLAGADQELTYCVSGDVAEEQIILGGSDTFATLVSSRSLRDRIASDSVGIILKTTKENTSFDN